MNIKQAIFDAVNEANEIIEKRVRTQEKIIEYNRTINAGLYKDRANIVLKELPSIIKEGILNPKQTDCGHLKICTLDIDNDLINHDCGSANPKPGSFGEYLFNRLAEIGLSPRCFYEPTKRNFWGNQCYQAYMSINLSEVLHAKKP